MPQVMGGKQSSDASPVLVKLPEVMITSIFTLLDVRSHRRLGLASKSLQAASKKQSSFPLRLRVQGFLLGLNIEEKCDWKAAGRLLDDQDQDSIEVRRLQAQLLMERINWDEDCGAELHRRAMDLLRSAAKDGDWYSRFFLAEDAFRSTGLEEGAEAQALRGFLPELALRARSDDACALAELARALTHLDDMERPPRGQDQVLTPHCRLAADLLPCVVAAVACVAKLLQAYALRLGF